MMKQGSFVGALLVAGRALAQEDAVVVTATRTPQPTLEVPAAVDRIYSDEIREGRPQVNLSESLGRVPGISVQNRQNYAQDLQIQSRGFGARSTFGVRGIRLIADGIPATAPDGQGQASTFDLGSAERIEVLRGPFSALYGNASGGVIAVDTQDGPRQPTLDGDFLVGSYQTKREALRFGGQFDDVNAIGGASRFQTNGYRDHSWARRDQENAKIKVAPGDSTTLTLVGNSLRQPDTQDPLGLTKTEKDANPRQATPNALLFNTKKSIAQDQAGGTLAQRFAAQRRAVPRHPGGDAERGDALRRDRQSGSRLWRWGAAGFFEILEPANRGRRRARHDVRAPQGLHQQQRHFRRAQA